MNSAIVWVALPNGWAKTGTTLSLSVFVSPRLLARPSLSGSYFENWPHTLGAQAGGQLKFSVTFEGIATVAATTVSTKPVHGDWALIFDAPKTEVKAFAYDDLSTAPFMTYPVAGVDGFVSSFYTAVATQSPYAFPTAKLLEEYLPWDGNNYKGTHGWAHVEEAIAFHELPPSVAGAVHDPNFKPAVPTFEFHQTLSTLMNYPALMRRLGLVFDLEVAAPHGLTSPVKVQVTPEWHPALTNVDTVSPQTVSVVTGSSFRAQPKGPDYGNGMLSLQDASRFLVSGYDPDGAADRLSLMATKFRQTRFPSRASGLPALRTGGPAIIWQNWGEKPSAGPGRDLLGLLESQLTNNAAIESYISSGGTTPVPVVYAEDVMRGLRFDVLTMTETTPTWRSLHLRNGTYVVGAAGATTLTIDDEGSTVPGVSQPHGLATYDAHTGVYTPVPDPPDIYVHERIMRWRGWSLAAQRPGMTVSGPGTDVVDNGTNPVPPNEGGFSQPQLSVSFTAPTSGANLLPKLRFGALYRYRARGADLAGNGVAVTSTDDSTSTAPTTHLRFEPVASPPLAAIAPPVPGEGMQLIPILDWMDGTAPTPNSRWVFPPKVSELLAEEHGMLDGFLEGSPPNPDDPPSGATATYNLLVQRDPATMNSVPGVEYYGSNFDSAGNPQTSGPYFAGATMLSVPWIPDPMSSGICLAGTPTTPAFVTRFWDYLSGDTWPDPLPLLLTLAASSYGTQSPVAASESYTAATPSLAAVETLAIPQGETLLLSLSSATYPGSTGAKGALLGLYCMGAWQWLANAGLSSTELADYEKAANAGLLWQLTPPIVLELVHAVRIPLAEPTFGSPAAHRTAGSTKATIVDTTFSLDVKSTSSLDVLATWTDPIDDVANPAPTTATTNANAFKLTVDVGFDFGATDPAQTTEDFGDTHHHSVDYTAIGTSRFNGYFRQTESVTFSGTTPVSVSPTFGLDAASVRLTIPGTPATDFGPDDFTADATAGTVALTNAGVTLAGSNAIEVSWIPGDTLSGPAATVPVLSTARPVAPAVARVVPAWQLLPISGKLSGSGLYTGRYGNFLRVYLDRPWYSSGGGELLGVVTLTSSTLPSTEQLDYTTVLGVDPIYDSMFTEWGSFTGPQSFTNLATLPSVPGRSAYSNPPRLGIPEDVSGSFNVWPYEVTYDPASQLWFADVQLSFADEDVFAPDGAYPPYFVRLALARFQPWSLDGYEVSPVVLATIAQPVPDRLVVVTEAPGGVNALQVQVEGWGYGGFRPAAFNTAGDPDTGISTNQNHPETFGSPAMVVEMQEQDTSGGLSGDFGWNTVGDPVILPAPSNAGGFLSWAGEVPLPAPGSAVSGPLRVRVSEIDFYTSTTAPVSVDTTYRRPFVVHIPLASGS